MRGGYRLGHSAFRVPQPRKLGSVAAQLLRGETRLDEHGDLLKSWPYEVSSVVNRLASQLLVISQPATEPAIDDELESA